MAFEGEMPTAPLVIGGILTAPIWIPGLAVWGAYHGLKAAAIHGIVPAFKKIAEVSKREAQ
jgi:hypothetical protein